jgi:hypothetical protein
MRIRPITVAIASILAVTPIAAQAAAIECPGSITEAPTVAVPNAAWSVVAKSGERPLDQAGIYIVIGTEYGSQVPDVIRKAKREEHVSWRMPSPTTERYWLGCSYLGTTALLMIELDPAIKSCVATYTLLKTGRRQQLKNIDCR